MMSVCMHDEESGGMMRICMHDGESGCMVEGLTA